MAEIGIGLVGYKFMGRAHSNAWRQVASFFDVDPTPRRVAICGRDEQATQEAAATLGWEGYETDYHKLVQRDDIQLVDVSTPGYTHREIVLAALEAGKHVLCEKPLANTLDEARQMAQAAKKAGTVNMVNFNYRRAPAVQLAKQLVESGKLGEIRHWRAVYLQDWIVDPEAPLTWRMKKELAGSGALGDIGAHIIDLATFLVGQISEVTGMAETFIKERPVEVSSSGGSGLSSQSGKERGEVTVDDAVAFLTRFDNGTMGTFEATRMAPGRRNRNSFEISGSKGSVVWDLERLNELEVFLVEDEEGLQGFRRINVTEPVHPYAGNWWPAGHILGYEHTFVHAVKDLLDAIKENKSPSPSFEEGFRVQAVLDAVQRSAESRQWEKPDYSLA